MLISIVKTDNVGVAQTETTGLFIKSEKSSLAIFERRKRARIELCHSYDLINSHLMDENVITTRFFHN